VTVCIAALCQLDILHPELPPCIVGATDRKVTAGNIQYEPPQAKWYGINEHIVALVAGDIEAQIGLCQKVAASRPRLVENAVTAYCRELAEHNLRQSEMSVLARYGLSMQSFLRGQQRMSRDFVRRVQQQINDACAGVETIICGVDQTGHHLYTIDSEGKSRFNNPIGFTAIGDGYWHAESQFMFARYTPRWSLAKAMLLAYAAKKRAEVAPGVGEYTEMFLITGTTSFPIADHVVAGLDRAYQKLRSTQDQAIAEANESIEQFVAEISQLPQQGSVTSPTPPDSTPPST
jgi:20S proteasome alpha/beta subunit